MIFKKTIVILYEKLYNVNMVNDLKAYLLSTHSDHYVVAIDDMKYVYSDTGKLARFFNVAYQKHMPRLEMLNSKIADFSDTLRLKRARAAIKKNLTPKASKKEKNLNNSTLRNVKNIFYRHTPDLVICMTAHSLAMAIRTKALLNSNAGITAFVPEVCLPKAFVNYDCDGYYVLNKEVRSQLLSLGVREDIIVVTGFPPHLERNTSSAIEIQNDLPVVLISSGDIGQKKLLPVYAELLENVEKYNLVVDLAGNDKTAKYDKLSALCPAREHVILAQEKPFEALLKQADLLITLPDVDKAYMAFHSRIPCVVVKPYTLHQQRTANYFNGNGIALTASNGLSDTVLQLISDSTAAEKLKTAASIFITGQSVSTAVLSEQVIEEARETANSISEVSTND